MNAQSPIVEPDAPEQWRAEPLALDERWLEIEQQDAMVRAWLDSRESETVSAACMV